MAITFYWRCEGTTFSGTHDYSAGDSTPTSLGSPTIAGGAAKVGSFGISCPVSVTSHYEFDATSILGMVGSVGYWFQAVSANPASGTAYGFQAVGTDTTDLIAVYASGTDEIQFRNSNSGTNSNLTSTSADLVAGNWYGVIIRWDFTTPSSSSKKLEVYNSAGSLISGLPAELTGANLTTSVPADLVSIQCGRHSSGSAVVQYADNFIIGSGYNDVTAAMLAYDSYTDFTPSLVTKVKILAPAAAASAASIQGVVLNAARDTVIGEFTGQTFETDLEGGEAVLKIIATDITPDGSTLTTSDAPLVVAYNTSYSTDLAAATVIEE